VIYYRNATRAHAVDEAATTRLVRTLLAAVDEEAASLALSFVGDRAIRTLNRTHRGKDRATDVLSFPLYEPDAVPVGPPVDGEPERLLGDLVVSVDTARRQARAYDATLAEEIARLLVHGVLHLMGHDHLRPDERARMEAEERRLAAAVGMTWPYDMHGAAP